MNKQRVADITRQIFERAAAAGMPEPDAYVRSLTSILAITMERLERLEVHVERIERGGNP